MRKNASVQAKPLKLNAKVNTPSVIYTTESQYLLDTNRKRCRDILNKQKLSKGDMIDFLISLHLVLEIGMNSLFRRIVAANHQANNYRDQIIEYLDKVGFIEKTASFISFSKFTFSIKEDATKLRKYEDLLRKLRFFADIRNRLIHGASISETTHVDPQGQKTITHASKAAKALNEKAIRDQVRRSRFVVEAMSFYVDHLDSHLTDDGKRDILKQFLDSTFLDI